MSHARTSAIHKAIRFLQEGQLPWGEFSAKRFSDQHLSGNGSLDSSPFPTTLVLHTLGFVSDSLIPLMRERAIRFLLENREEPGVWRYWTPRTGRVIDPDLDDTCCASFALKEAGCDVAANVVCILENRHSSGLFKTWLRSSEADNDVDGAVNANVLLYLGEREETKAAREIVTNAILQDREEEASWYYTSPLALYYMVSRALFHGVEGLAACRDAMVEKTLDCLRKTSEPMLHALALCLFANCTAQNRRLSAIADGLIDTQRDDGAWPRAAFYRGPEPPQEHSVWWGSEEITTAFCVEALARQVAR